MIDKRPLYNPVDKRKSHKPKRGHPWKKWSPGFLRSTSNWRKSNEQRSK